METDPEGADALVDYVREQQGEADWLPFALFAHTCRERAGAETVQKITRSAIETAARSAIVRLADRGGPTLTNTVGAPTAVATSQNLSELEFAELMGVSSRTIAYDRKQMTEGVHYHRHGRRVLYHVPEAQEFIRTYRGSLSRGADDERLAIDEVTRRRARVALKKTGNLR